MWNIRTLDIENFDVFGHISGNKPYTSVSELAEGTGFLHLIAETCLASQYGQEKLIINFSEDRHESSNYHLQHKMFLRNAIYKN